MLKIKSYVKVNSLAEAYELNQKKTACILGGMVWMKMGNRAISTAIDLSGLGLDAISENDDEFVIGCMTPLHDLETNEALNTYTHGAMKESLCTVQKLCHCGRKHLWKIWLLRCSDHVPGNGYMGRII